MRKALVSVLFAVLVSIAALGQTTPPSAFATTTFSFNLSPISLPNIGTSLSGAETDAMFSFTTNNQFGETSLIGASTFIGGRYDHIFPSVAKYLQNHTALTGGNFQFGATSSLGVVKAQSKSLWGGRVGLFLRYAPAGSQNFNIGFEAQANYLPEYASVTSPHWIPSIALGPNFRF